MDLPKCRTCGERHRLGPCPSSHPKNTPEASGTARKAPSGLVLAKPSRNSVRASTLAKVDDGVALTSMAHPPGLIDKIAGAIRSGKLKISPPNPVAKAIKGKAGTAEVKGLVRGSTTGTGLRVGEAVAVQPATSEFMDATGRRDAHQFQVGGNGKSQSAQESRPVPREGKIASEARSGRSKEASLRREGEAGLPSVPRNASSLPAIPPPRSKDKEIRGESRGGDEDVSGGDQGGDSKMRSLVRQLPREAALGAASDRVATAPSFDREQYHRDYMRKYMRDRRAARREAEKAK
jgi:hypothetical protein